MHSNRTETTRRTTKEKHMKKKKHTTVVPKLAAPPPPKRTTLNHTPHQEPSLWAPKITPLRRKCCRRRNTIIRSSEPDLRFSPGDHKAEYRRCWSSTAAPPARKAMSIDAAATGIDKVDARFSPGV